MEEPEVNYIEVDPKDVETALRQLLKAERLRRWNAEKDAPHGLKSGPFRQLEREGKLNTEFILAEAPKIQAKTSELPSGQRAYISDLMDAAVNKALRWKLDREKKEKAQQPSTAPTAPAEKPKATKARKSTTEKKTPAKAAKTAKKSKTE